MLNDFAESKITVKKSDLLAALRKNREKHALEYVEAYEGYKKAFVEEATKLLNRAKEGKFEKTTITCAPPQDHTKDYDRVISMMEMSTADEITLMEQQFSQYVLDEWRWQNEFKALSARYSGLV